MSHILIREIARAASPNRPVMFLAELSGVLLWASLVLQFCGIGLWGSCDPTLTDSQNERIREGGAPGMVS